jgi:F0F1-type ATP synthase assembly protein I
MMFMADQHGSDPSPQRTPKSVWVGAEKYIQLGLTLPAATVVGWILGELLNRWLHREWLPLAGLIFGVISGFVYFIRVAMSEDFKE